MKYKRYERYKSHIKYPLKKKAQLSYEYIVIIGLVIFLVAVFFFTYMGGVNSRLGSNLNTDAVVRIADASYEVSNLGTGSMVLTPLRILSVFAANVSNDTISIDASAGKFDKRTVPHSVSGVGILSGSGFFHIPIQSGDFGTVIIGDKPAITYITAENSYPSYNTFGIAPTIKPSDKFWIWGGNFVDNSRVIVIKISGPGGRGAAIHASSTENSRRIKVEQPILGKGTYEIVVENPGPNNQGQSNRVRINVKSGGVGGGDD